MKTHRLEWFLDCVKAISIWEAFLAALFFLILFVFYARKFRLNPGIDAYIQYTFILVFNVSSSLCFLFQDAIHIHQNPEHNQASFVLFLIVTSLTTWFGKGIGVWVCMLTRKKKMQFRYVVANALLLISFLLPFIVLIAFPVYSIPIKELNKKTSEIHKGIITNVIKLSRKDAQSVPSTERVDFIDPTLKTDPNVLVSVEDNHAIVFHNRIGKELFRYSSLQDEVSEAQFTKIIAKNAQQYYAVLAIMPARSGESNFLVFKPDGECIYYEKFDDYIWQLKIKSNEVMLQKVKHDSTYQYIDYWLYSF